MAGDLGWQSFCGGQPHTPLSMFGLRPFIEVKVRTKTGWELALPPRGNASYRSSQQNRKGKLTFSGVSFSLHSVAAPLYIV